MRCRAGLSGLKLCPLQKKVDCNLIDFVNIYLPT
jgi:hypothetical protein